MNINSRKDNGDEPDNPFGLPPEDPDAPEDEPIPIPVRQPVPQFEPGDPRGAPVQPYIVVKPGPSTQPRRW